MDAGSTVGSADSLREFVWHELHARPYVRFSGPAHVLHFLFLTAEGTESEDEVTRERVKAAFHLRPSYEMPRHAIYVAPRTEAGHLVMSWERHSEFVTYTFFLYELARPFTPFDAEIRTGLPDEFLQLVGDAPLVRTHLSIGPKAAMGDTPDAMMALFEGHTVNGSEVMDGGARVWTAFRAHDSGYGRIAIVSENLSPHSLGRTVERLIAIENFLHLTLLALPPARELKPDLVRWDAAVVEQTEALRGAASLEQKRAVLSRFLEVAAEIEHARSRVAGRFGASSAYYALLENRFEELRETKIEHVLRLSSFALRRVAPAAQTCQSVVGRLNDLSRRIDNAAQLLRTSIELHVDEQSRRLLAAGDRRARMQLELQTAVETLSIVAVAYYVLSLAAHVLKGIIELGVPLHEEVVLGVGAPVLVLLAWIVMQMIRKRFQDPATDEELDE